MASYIRDLRLARCRRDLADPALRNQPVQAIAARWGFSDKAHFSRVFRAAHGVDAAGVPRRATRIRRGSSTGTASTVNSGPAD